MFFAITFCGFTIIMDINYFFSTSLGSIADCFCFGLFLHFTPLASFVKSLVLFVLTLLSIGCTLWNKPIKLRTSIRIVLLLSLLSFATNIQAQNKAETRVGGSVYDSFTNVGLPAFVTLLNKDSIAVDTTTCQLYRGNAWFTFYLPKVSGDYMVRVEYPGYKTSIQKQYFDFSKPSRGYGFPTVLLKRLANAEDSMRSIGLNEIVVRGTRLQVAYRGDTLVYDAQAFNLPEGAMLDALVRQLPGAELKANGDVYINGKRLDYITLNGNDFFKGKNKVILENLPYFVVKELQVYYKDPPFALEKSLTDDGKDYVLDVVMKREYAIGSIINTEAGIGTDDRWKAKVFGLRYDDYSRLAIFGNFNNVNEDRTPGTDGDWSPKKQARGLLTTKQVGANLNLYNAKKTFALDQYAIAEWTDNCTNSQQHSETFASEGNIIGNKTTMNNIKNFSLTDKTNLNVKLHSSVISSNLYLIYNSGKSINSSIDSTFCTSLINTDQYLSQADNRELHGNGYFGWRFRFNSPYKLSVSSNFSFSNQWHDKYHVLHDIQYFNTGEQDGRNDYRDNTTRSYRYDLSTEHSYSISPRISLSYRLSFEQKGDGRDNDYFRLYQFGGQYSRDLILPSTTDSLQAALDFDNTYDYFMIGRGISNTISASYQWKNTSVFMTLRYTYSHERIRFHKMELDTIARRNYSAWNPNLSVRHKWGKNSLEIKYYFTDSQPNFSMLMPLNNTTNPLNKRLSNPDLKSQQRNNIDIKFDKKPEKMKPAWWIKYSLVTLNRAWGNKVNYDTTTGGYTSIADNVNGNWNTSLSFGMNGPIGKKKYLLYDISADADYVHSVDYNTAYDGEPNELSRVNTFRPTISTKLNFRKGIFSAGIVTKLSGNFSHEEEYGERDMNVREYQFGFITQYTIPVVKFTIGTDLNLYSQRGYESATMNTDDWVWNAFISRPFFKGKMVAKIEMYDILHQLSTRSYSINAQSRVETYYNSIPHYVMFSLGYKFAKSPKK